MSAVLRTRDSEQAFLDSQQLPPDKRGISFEAQPGESIALVGVTGAGKSTLVSLIPRFFDPWNGKVLLDGHDIRDLKLGYLRSQIAMVLQESVLFPISIVRSVPAGSPTSSRRPFRRSPL